MIQGTVIYMNGQEEIEILKRILINGFRARLKREYGTNFNATKCLKEHRPILNNYDKKVFCSAFYSDEVDKQAFKVWNAMLTRTMLYILDNNLILNKSVINDFSIELEKGRIESFSVVFLEHVIGINMLLTFYNDGFYVEFKG